MTSNPERDLHTYLPDDVAHSESSPPVVGGLPRCTHGAPVWACNAAPAGLPLHEPTDRDADNVPTRHVSTRCPRMAEHHQSAEMVKNDDHTVTVVRRFPIPCDQCYSVESVVIPWEEPGPEKPLRDADNVPSDRVRAYAEAFRSRKGPRCGECVELDDWSDCAECDAVVAVGVADREQAELRAEVERLHGRLADSERTITDLSSRVKRREAAIARVEALADDLTDDEPSGSLSPEITAWANWAGERIRAALRGPEPTDAP